MLIRPLIIAARILDEDYPKDPNPENWRTISGAKVHLNEKGQIDGGAGSKFNKKKFGSNFSAQEGFSGEYAAPNSSEEKSPIKKAASVFTEASVQPYNAKESNYPFRKSNYTKAHKDTAVWCKSMEESKKKIDAQALTVWESANHEEREAIKKYTAEYEQFNDPLRGYEYGTGQYKGVGSIDFENIGNNSYGKLKPGEARDLITNMTNYIDRSAFDEDIWLQRGCSFIGMDKFFNLRKPMQDYTLDELRAEILGTKPTEHGFMSCGAAKGTGFDKKPVILNIYAPAGTKMAYTANFSIFEEENEMVLQRGTQFRVAKVEEKPGEGFFIDLEVVGYNIQKV